VPIPYIRVSQSADAAEESRVSLLGASDPPPPCQAKPGGRGHPPHRPGDLNTGLAIVVSGPDTIVGWPEWIPSDDSKTRWILLWYRFDPERNERRYVPVGAYTRARVSYGVPRAPAGTRGPKGSEAI
jgi:hypothetical protein